MKHRCAVCWVEQGNHDEWFTHATEEHGAVLAEFGMRLCTNNPRNCTGVKHALRLPNQGHPRVNRVRNDPAPFTARDGTTYTPIPLPMERR